MHIGQRYTLKEFLYWNRRDVYWIILIATVITLLYSVGGLHGIAIPWVPVALVGTGAAFIVGFKNTQSYARLWEARQIWGAIINASRAFGMLIRDTTTADHAAVTQIFHRHFAWLTALRYQLRERKAWEYTQLSHYQDYLRHYAVPEWDEGLEKLLKEYLTGTDFSYIMKKRNKATQLIAIQSEHIKKLRAAGLISELNYVAI